MYGLLVMYVMRVMYVCVLYVCLSVRTYVSYVCVCVVCLCMYVMLCSVMYVCMCCTDFWFGMFVMYVYVMLCMRDSRVFAFVI